MCYQFFTNNTTQYRSLLNSINWMGHSWLSLSVLSSNPGPTCLLVCVSVKLIKLSCVAFWHITVCK